MRNVEQERMGRRIVRKAGAAGLLTLAAAGVAGTAHAQLGPQDRGYVGPSFLEVPGIKGAAKDAPRKGQIAVAAHYWKTGIVLGSAGTLGAPGEATAERRAQARPARSGQAAPDFFGRRRAFLSVPAAPREGEGTVIIAVAKESKGLKELMARCHSKTVIPELIYSVSSERSRTRLELGPRPAEMPEYFDFKLKNVELADCPVVAGAADQAFVVKFADIEWLNWKQEAAGAAVSLTPARFQVPAKVSGSSRSWVINWIANANDVSNDQCPVMNAKPTEDQYFTYLPKDVAEKERVELKAKGGGVNYENNQMGARGPSRINVTYLPGIVPDPGMAEPQTRIARGLNLDDDDGTKFKHRNYVSADGKVTGIDNQLYTVQGCVAGWQGHKGFQMQFANNQYHDGEMSMLVEISGIDDDRNDDQVFVDILYSQDRMAKNAAGNMILTDYSFDVTTKPELAHYNVRLPAKIVDGVVITTPVKELRLNLGIYGTPPELVLADARMRFEILANGNLKGVVGGYRDWRVIAGSFTSSASEFYHGFQQPALYYALKRNADGMKNPVTGEYDGISGAFDIEGVPAFVGSNPSSVVAAPNVEPATKISAK